MQSLRLNTSDKRSNTDCILVARHIGKRNPILKRYA